jgi:hypothetical protein
MRKSILLTLLMIILGPTSLIPVKAQDLVYVSVDPCRIVDTRNAGGAIPANSFRNFRVSGTVGQLAVQGGTTNCLDPKAGTGLKPAAISAYVLAVPATSSTSGGDLTAYPSDQLPPPVGAGSTVNFAAGQTIGNTTNITLCNSVSCPTDGEFAILARSTNQHVVVDVQGYYYPATLADGPCYDNQNRYVDCGNGTVTDTVTGFIWTKDAGCIPPQDYASANNVAAALEDGSCGLTDNSRPGDWHLPTQAEWAATIEEAVRLGCTLPNPPSLTDTTGTVCFNAGPQPFDNVDAAGTALYWSSTAVPDNPQNAYEWNTNGNTTANTAKVNLVQGWAIRGRH